MPHQDSDRVSALLAAVEGLGPIIREYRPALDNVRNLPPAIVQALVEAKLTRLWLPRDLGGEELSLTGYLRVVEALARHDGAVAWCISIAANGSRLAGLLHRDTAQELYGEKGFCCGSATPAGTAIAEGDGWRIIGRWPWASFIGYSSVAGAMCIEHANGAPRLTPKGTPRFRMVMVPTDKVRILDTWNGGGLRATGSHDFCIENVWVPDTHTIDYTYPDMKSYQPSALYKLPSQTTAVFALAPVLLGIARASIDGTDKFG